MMEISICQLCKNNLTTGIYFTKKSEQITTHWCDVCKYSPSIYNGGSKFFLWTKNNKIIAYRIDITIADKNYLLNSQSLESYGKEMTQLYKIEKNKAMSTSCIIEHPRYFIPEFPLIDFCQQIANKLLIYEAFS